ncbi:MAG: hypothetical protein D6819_08440, partial [Gammaproteobacteria bacterium]
RMAIKSDEIISKLDPSDQKKIEYFIKLLLRQKKYQALRQEIEKRRREISEGKVLEHEEFWKQLSV